MIYFNNDYLAGAHPEVLRRLVETNLESTPGYGFDEHTARAKRLILEACGLTDGAVHLLVGGTQTNAVVIDRLLDLNDGVLCTEDAHIAVHEAGAIEASGHKVMTLPSHDGKVSAADVTAFLDDHYGDATHEHKVRPGMLFISFPTELGTLYTREELTELSDVCHRAEIPLYIDGARMAYGLAASTDLTLKEIAALADVFYIGGTKCGALFGEAVVTRRPELLPRFMSVAKLHGALLAKGRLTGVQFEALFDDGLYYRLGAEAVDKAMQLRLIFLEAGYEVFFDSPTNQQFFLLPNDVIRRLSKEVGFELWGPMQPEKTPVRFVTSWSATQKAMETLKQLIDIRY